MSRSIRHCYKALDLGPDADEAAVQAAFAESFTATRLQLCTLADARSQDRAVRRLHAMVGARDQLRTYLRTGNGPGAAPELAFVADWWARDARRLSHSRTARAVAAVVFSSAYLALCLLAIPPIRQVLLG